MSAERKKALLILFIVVATELIGFGLIIPVLPQIALGFSVSKFHIGILMAAYSAAQFISAPLLGSLSDRYGRKPLLVLSKLGTVLGYVVMAMSSSYLMFLMSRLIDGFTGGNISVARAYISDITPPEDRSKGMAVIGIAFGTGFILGPALGGLLYSETYGYHLAAVVAGSLSLIAALLTLFFLKEPDVRRETRSAGSLLRGGFSAVMSLPVISICFVYLVYMIVFSGFESTFSVFTNHLFGLTVRQNSMIFMYAGVLGFIVQGSIMRKRVLELKRVAVVGLLIAGAAFACLSFSTTIGVLLASIAFLSLGIGLLNSFLPSLVSIQSQNEVQGTVMGFYEGIGSLSRILGPVLAYSTVMYAPRYGYLAFAGTLLCLALFLIVNRKVKAKAV